MARKRKVEGYMCAIDWQHELGEALGGNKIYPSVEDLKENHKMWKECGIVKVSVQLVEWVEDQNIGGKDGNEKEDKEE